MNHGVGGSHGSLAPSSSAHVQPVPSVGSRSEYAVTRQPSQASLVDLVRHWHSRAFAISPWHGRSRSAHTPDHGWLSFKGGGWTWGNQPILVSRKDRQLVFGLYGQADAERELAVSDILLAQGARATRVLGWVPVELSGIFSDSGVAAVRYSDGTPVQPVVLVTSSKVPARVADLGFLHGPERVQWIERACDAAGWRVAEFVQSFAAELGRSLAQLHQRGGTNDVLTWDNITLAAEWTDFEWFYYPGYPLPDGTTDVDLQARQWKSCIDAFEVVDRLAALVCGVDGARHEAIDVCLHAYEQAKGPIAIGDDWYGRQTPRGMGRARVDVSR
jgi:hypothetical protein